MQRGGLRLARRVAGLLLAVGPGPALGSAADLLPRPAHLEARDGTARVARDVCLSAPIGTRAEAGLLAERLAARGWTGRIAEKGCGAGPAILLETGDATLGPEAYRIAIDADRVRVTAGSAAGLYYGTETLLQLLPERMERGARIGNLRIVDSPRHAWRGLSVDTVRHRMPVAFLHRLIEQMGAAKLNRLHLSLTDDQGWRFDVPGYPKLASVASVRGETLVGHRYEMPPQFDGTPHGGLYTAEEIAGLVAHAARRHIAIVPGLNAPGHATAALVAYPDLASGEAPAAVPGAWGVFPNLLRPDAGTDRFLGAAMAELAQAFPAPYLHLGGDEVVPDRWHDLPGGRAAAPARLAAFLDRQAGRARALSRTPIFWDDAVAVGLPADAIVMAWRGAAATRAALARGHRVIVADNGFLYLDYAQAVGAAEPVGLGPVTPIAKTYGFDPAAGQVGAERILGVQAALWTEYVADAAAAEHMLFPRLAAVAEMAWTPQQLRSWPDFARRLPAQMRRYQQAGIGAARSIYTVEPTPMPDGRVRLTTEVPAPAIRYTLDGEAPTPRSRLAGAHMPVPPRARLRAAAFDGAQRIGPELDVVLDRHLAFGQVPRFGTAPDRRFFPSPDTLLVDGQGGGSLLAGGWQGFTGAPLDATIDLGGMRCIGRIGVAFGLLPAAGVLLPASVELELSDDGRAFRPVPMAGGDVEAAGPPALRGQRQQRYRAQPGQWARHVRLVARPAPAGSATTLAADEIVIEPCGPSAREVSE